MNTTLSPTNQKHVHDCNDEVDLKVYEMTLLLSRIKQSYLDTGDLIKHAAAENIITVLADLEKHRIVQNKFLADEGDVYVHGYTNALKQMVLDLDILIKHYQPVSK